jgi:nifR3 family TIM-barrel protein
MINGMFSSTLQNKIDGLQQYKKTVSLGGVSLCSPLMLAPMSMITNAPFRLLMQNLGAGGTVSDLISCHGILHGNKKTRHMLYIDPRETNVGIQLFGEDKHSMAEAAKIAQDFGPAFIDINMGCPVRKVVSKGAGSALLKNPKELYKLFRSIKSVLKIPLTIKIRTGWEENSKNAPEVLKIAREEGIEFVAIHGRTRAQGYSGEADWDYLEALAEQSLIPTIGNGDLHHPSLVQQRLKKTKCQALMLGRGPLRNPFIFLKSLEPTDDIEFLPCDYLEIINVLEGLLSEYYERQKEGSVLIQLRKFILWFSSGFKGAAKFRETLFKCQDIKNTLSQCEKFFLSLEEGPKQINFNTPFMNSGHG